MGRFRLIDWMDNAPAPARASAVPALVRSYVHGDLTAEAREMMEAALTLIADDPSPDVRRALAEALSIHETAPRHLIVALSQDLPAVAEPIFRRSPCLIDSELTAAVELGTPSIAKAIASRPWISFDVADAIAAEGDREAVLVMLGNPGADLDGEAFAVIAERLGADGEIREALFARRDLPLAVRQSLISALGEKLGRFLVGRAWIAPKRAGVVLREACDKATVFLAGSAEEAELSALIEHLRSTGQLTTALLIRSMCEGHIRFLEAALARLSGLPAPRVYALLMDGRAGALRALFTRAGLPERSHAAFLAALEVWRELDYDGRDGDKPRFGRRMVERILTRYQEFAPGEVDDLLAMLRRLAAESARTAAREILEARREGRQRAA
ncbi:DUF2336 domain-containing protein [Pleomorphomonas sp. JP5]|uniref:DUF2336 domain-containing protein n=1 Tax=Pleomorphomonas sp. JP5 TaxID=2942998 RepID=UPI0020430B99|nr:DUF2336 domain-containing protein [Pleomorphomonas sp. JP5]MCM5557775.1 DUF2336 domain-containing protein [Pleomorphomonas sp. JP5]